MTEADYVEATPLVEQIEDLRVLLTSYAAGSVASRWKLSATASLAIDTILLADYASQIAALEAQLAAV